MKQPLYFDSLYRDKICKDDFVVVVVHPVYSSLRQENVHSVTSNCNKRLFPRYYKKRDQVLGYQNSKANELNCKHILLIYFCHTEARLHLTEKMIRGYLFVCLHQFISLSIVYPFFVFYQNKEESFKNRKLKEGL